MFLKTDEDDGRGGLEQISILVGTEDYHDKHTCSFLKMLILGDF